MTNILAAILVTVTTNWSEIGTATMNDNQKFTIEQGRLRTNTLAVMEWRGNKHEVQLEHFDGPVVGERRVLIPAWQFQPAFPVLTNILPWVIPFAVSNYTNKAILLN